MLIVFMHQSEVATSDRTLIDKMVKTCDQPYKVIDAVLEYECGELIDKVEGRDYEVLYKNGKFWVEYPIGK